MDVTEENVEPSNQSDLSGVETPPSEERSVEGQQEDMGTDASNNTADSLEEKPPIKLEMLTWRQEQRRRSRL
ncbi:hypothetical protein BSL78_21597 [Apostichopus japonicus]|uniref:Uncharacterized protein n=1 Tax=Stichopus japonicus TaxID=307972 RepID=A0A2G8K0L6_STIJA|nr:hypothetical protein BSL78_21597 [Apostichopus japonicus]